MRRLHVDLLQRKSPWNIYTPKIPEWCVSSRVCTILGSWK